MSRPSLDEYFVKLLGDVKLRASCPRRQGSAIIVDDDGHILSSGYNGPGSGIPNCYEEPCDGRYDESGDTSNCIAVHAEANALLQCGDRLQRAVTMYCSTRPCFNCCKLLTNTKIKRIVFIEDYPDTKGLKLLTIKGIKLEKYGDIQS